MRRRVWIATNNNCQALYGNEGKSSMRNLIAASTKWAVLVALLFASNAYAGWANGWRTITNIYPHDGGVTFNTDGSIVVPAAPCGNRFILALGTANYSAKMASLLSLH